MLPILHPNTYLESTFPRPLLLLLSILLNRGVFKAGTFNRCHPWYKHFVMWFRKRETDIEMEGMRGQPKHEPLDTDYRPINWKRILLSPKYIRTFTESAMSCPALLKQRSVAYTQHRYPRSNNPHLSEAR